MDTQAAINAAELPLPADWCQRWLHRRHSWRHRHDGGFLAERYEVAPLDEPAAKALVVEHHYSGSYPAARLAYGLHDLGAGGALVGVAVLSVPVQQSVLTNVFPGLIPYRESLELGRFLCLPSVAANGESWFLGRVFALAARDGIGGVVSYADPVPRRNRITGAVVLPGHLGIIYQASNATYTGRGTARSLLLLPDGSVLNARSLQKVRAQEPGHAYVEERLCQLGVRPRGHGESPASWVRAVLGSPLLTRISHGGAHRYAFRLGETRRERSRITVALPPAPYPKQLDAAA